MATAASVQPVAAAADYDPAAEYRQRLAARTEHAGRLARHDRQITVGRRLLLFAVIGYVVFDPTEAQALVPLAIAMVPLAIWQNSVLRAWRRVSRAAAYYERGLARLEDRWIGRGQQGRRYLDDTHPYADDLDIFGRGSLFQLLSTAQTPIGQDTLARWLAWPEDVATIRSRQQLVRELRDSLDLRERLASLDADLGHVEPDELVAWADAPPIESSPVARIIGLVLAWGLTISTVAAIARGGFWGPLLLALVVAEALFYLAVRRPAREVATHVGAAGHALSVLYRLHDELRRSPEGARILAAQATAIERVLTMPLGFMATVYGLTLRNSFLHALKVQGMPLWEVWRQRAAPHTRQALAAAGEVEALAALSAFAYERPSYPFPELREDGLIFDGLCLAHPLMPAAGCVANDVSLSAQRRLILISGSNMSGKSTLLRTIGTNTALALAGAPVRAERLTMSPLSLGTAMRFRDSVHEGASYFYAVLKRLRSILDLTEGPRPLLFLFDEILQGTNSQDRLAGAEALMHKLVDAGAIGLMTTHDLALTKIVDDFGPVAENMHCEDQVENGKMTFDYKLRLGVVTKSNALALMRAMGLDV